MARPPRFISEKQLPIEGAVQAPASLARQDTSIAQAVGGIGQAIGQIGEREQQVKIELEKRNRAAIDANSKVTARSYYDVANIKLAAFQETNPTEAWEEKFNEFYSEADRKIASLSLSDEAKDSLLTQNAAAKSFRYEQLKIQETTTNVDNAVIALGSDYESSIVERGDSEVVGAEYMDILKTKYGEAKAKVIFKKKTEDSIEELKKVSIENIKPQLITAIGEGKIDKADKKNSLDVLSNNVKSLVEMGILNEAEGAEADKVLGDWIDNYVSGREQKDAATAKLTSIESYQELMPIMLDGTKAQERFQTIAESKLSVKEKEKWNKYVKGSYKEAPTATTSEGQTQLNIAVFDAMTLEMSPTEAYDALLEERFVNGSITDKDFNWALKRIQNPYKKHTLEDLRFAIRANTSVVREGFNTSSEEKRLVDSNAALIQWVDEQLESGETPTRKEMNAMASQFRVVDGTLVDIGQIIIKNGVEFEVVGFDRNGDPMVEEAN